MQYQCVIFLQLFLLFTISFYQAQSEDESFCYTKPSCGPSTWGGSCQNNDGRQSPVNIDLRRFPPTGSLKSIMLSPLYRQTQTTFYIQKSNVTLRVDLLRKNTGIYFTGDGLNGQQYIFDQLHFHWGLNNYEGSEHSIDNYFYPLELHLVHYSNRYASFDEALESNQPDALAVIAVFFETSGNLPNPYMESIVNGISKANPDSTKTQVTGQINLASLLTAPENQYPVGTYSRYPGSLTTPPCTESVIFTVLLEPNQISRQQLQVFQNARNQNGEPVGNNFRPRQSLGARRLDTSFFRFV